MLSVPASDDDDGDVDQTIAECVRAFVFSRAKQSWARARLAVMYS